MFKVRISRHYSSVTDALQVCRPSCGQHSREVTVLANYIALSLNCSHLHLYKVKMWLKPTENDVRSAIKCIESPPARRAIFYEWMVAKAHTFCDHVNDYAFDGGSIIVARIPFRFPNGADQVVDEILCNTERDVLVGYANDGETELTVRLLISPLPDVLVDVANLDLRQRQLLNVILRAYRTAHHAAFQHKFFPMARGIFQIPAANQQGVSVARDLHHWQGLFSSVRACGEDNVPMVNFDVVNGAFHWMPGARLSDYFSAALPNMNTHIWAGRSGGKRFNCQNDLNNIQRPFRNLKVKADYVKPTTPYVCQRLYFKTAIDMMFEWTPSRATSAEAVAGNARVQQFLAGRASSLISVYDYFRHFYQIELQFPFLPLAETAGRGTRGRGRGDHESRHNYFPLEVLKVATPQRFSGQLPDKGDGVIVKEAAKGPDHRMRSIERMVRDACYVHDPFLDRFAIGLNNGLAVARARILPPPRVRFGGGFSVVPRDGVFSTGGDKPLFNTPRKISSFAVIYVSSAEPVGDQLSVLAEFADHVGMNARPFQGDECRRLAAHTMWTKPDGIAAALQKCCEFSKKQTGAEKPSVVFCIMPVRDLIVYSDVKRIAEIDLGVMTQCLLIKTAGDMARKADTRENVYMKVNCKIGGRNFIAEPAGCEQLPPLLTADKDGATLVVGIALTHPSSDANNVPSVAALLGSIDKEVRRDILIRCRMVHHVQLATYKPVVKVQHVRHANNVYTYDAASDLVLAWVINNPCTSLRNIVILRAGVGESEFAQVVMEEASGFDRVLRELNLSAAITFIVANKRHHTRFFPIDTNVQNQVSGRCKNVLPGLVVDRDLTDPHSVNWYQAPHQCIQGTTRPIKYTCLRNDAAITTERLQYLIETLCYSGQRCTRAIRCPAPIYFAQLAARRASNYIRSQMAATDAAASATASTSASLDSDSRSSRTRSSDGEVATGAGGDTTATADKLDETLAVPPVEEAGADKKAAGETTASDSDEKSAGDAGAAGEKKSKSSSDGGKKNPTDEDNSLSDGKRAPSYNFNGFIKVHQDVYEKGMYFM